MRVKPGRHRVLDGQPPLPMGVPCATWPAYGTRLLKREADLRSICLSVFGRARASRTLEEGKREP